jgi:hypothetical protein
VSGFENPFINAPFSALPLGPCGILVHVWQTRLFTQVEQAPW